MTTQTMMKPAMTTTEENASTAPLTLADQIRSHAKEARLTGAVLEAQLQQAGEANLRFLGAYLEAEVTSRRASARQRLLRAARLPSIKTLEDYDWTKVVLPPGVTSQSLADLDFLATHEDLICYGNVGCGKTHLATALTYQACQQNTRARFTTAADLIMELRKAKNEGHLDKALNNYKKFQLLTIDEVGYLPIDPEGARLLFQVISNTYEKTSLIITTNIPFSKWGTIFGDDNIAAAIIDRLIHHGRLLRHQGKSWRVTHALMQ